MQKGIITVVGKDTVGIIAKVCTYLSENGVNVLDISQTIVSGYFNMMMIVDMTKAAKAFADWLEKSDHQEVRAFVNIHQVPESRNLRYDAQNLGRKAVND